MGERQMQTLEDLEAVKQVHREIINPKATEDDLNEIYSDTASVCASSTLPVIYAMDDGVLSSDVIGGDND